MRACRNCIHVDDLPVKQQPLCGHPQAYAELPDYYNGTTYTAQHSVWTMRSIGPCGPDALLFEGTRDD